MKNNNDLKVDFARSKKLVAQLMFFLFFLIGITPLILIYFLAPDKLPLMFKMPSVFFLVLPISFFLILVLSFFIKIQNGITKMEIKHDHFFMTVYDKNKTKHNLSIPLEEIESTKLLVTQIFVYAEPKDIKPYTIVATYKDINNCIKAETYSRYMTLIYQLIINLKNGKSFNIIDEIPFSSLEFKKYFIIPSLLPNFSYKVNDISPKYAYMLKKRINSYILRGKDLGMIDCIRTYLASDEIKIGQKIGFLFAIILLPIAFSYVVYLLVKCFFA